MTTTVSPAPARRSLARRLGCGVLLVLWFALLCVPCLCAFIAINQEVTIPLGGAPGQYVRAWLVMEADQRGIGLSTPRVVPSTDANAICVETYNRFLLWQGRENDVVYCECYERADASAAWSLVSTSAAACGAG